MSIITVAPPPETNDIASFGFSALWRAKGLQSADSEVGGGATASLHAPLAIYHIDSKDLPQIEDSTENARLIGWKYLVKQGATAKTVEVRGSKVSSIGHSRIAAILIDTLEAAERSVPKHHQYEARILMFGREGNSLLWLHSIEFADRFFSLSDSPKELVNVEAFKAVSKAAQVRRLPLDGTKATGKRLPVDDESGG